MDSLLPRFLPCSVREQHSELRALPGLDVDALDLPPCRGPSDQDEQAAEADGRVPRAREEEARAALPGAHRGVKEFARLGRVAPAAVR